MAKGLRVHEGEHQDRVRHMIDRDAGDQAVGPEFRLQRLSELEVVTGGARGEGGLGHGIQVRPASFLK